MRQEFLIDSKYNKISGVMDMPDGTQGSPCVILSHGLVSSKESSKYVTLSERLVDRGIATCRFDFHGCGASEGDIRETTLTIRVANLSTIVDYVSKMPLIDPERIGALGSSFGGATTLVVAAKDRRIRCSSLWATPYRLDEKDDEEISGLRFKETIYSDFKRYDILKEASRLSCVLVIHGDKDEVVPLEEGLKIYECLKEPKRLEIIKGADHLFSDALHREMVIGYAVSWFERYLIEG
jgi:hypothetical protein